LKLKSTKLNSQRNKNIQNPKIKFDRIIKKRKIDVLINESKKIKMMINSYMLIKNNNTIYFMEIG